MPLPRICYLREIVAGRNLLKKEINTEKRREK